MPDLQIQLLGDFQIRYHGAPLDGFDAPRMQSLLAYLLLHRDTPQSRKHVAFLLWQDSSEKQAQGNLRNLLHRLRQALPQADNFLFADAQTLELRADASLSVDMSEFQALLGKARAENALESHTNRLTAAVNLYYGDLLPSCYDDWILPERERLREQFIQALAELVTLSQNEQDYTAAIAHARRLVQAEPLSEEPYRTLMTLYAKIGDRASVVRVYQTCVAVLKRELDAEPNKLTLETFQRLRRDDTPVERVITKPVAKPNLPAPLTSFVGRTRELGEIHRLLARARLVTLTGVGGCGKTRLALETAQELASRNDAGVWFVDFSPLSDPADVPRACAAAFGIREHTGASYLELMLEFIGDKELLLVLDNCEHVLNAAASLAQIILQAAPRARILATGREPLNLPGEALLIVPPLSLPAPGHATLETLAASDAVQLFTQRAVFLLPTFALNRDNYAAVAQICRRLDGIPLAIELAAARIRTLTPRQIAERLDDALGMLTRGSSGMPARHQTMRAVLDWSDALLSATERALFLRLSIFAGGFTLEAAEQVCSDHSGVPNPPPITRSNILDLLSNLIDKSLVTVADTEDGELARYRLLEPIRQYAAAKLTALGEQAVWGERHLEWCVDLADQLQAQLEDGRQLSALALLERENDNLRAALDFALHHDRRTRGLRLAASLERFWLMGGHSVEGRNWLKQLLDADALSGDTDPLTLSGDPALQARALVLLGALAWRQSDYVQAEASGLAALRIWQALGDRAGIAFALRQLAEVSRARGDYARAVEMHTESLRLSRELNHRKGIANVLGNLGATYSEQGAYARATELYQEGLALALELGDIWLIALYKNNLGVALRDQDPAQAEIYFRETLVLRRSLGDPFGVAISLRNLGENALQRKNWQEARTYFRESMSINAGLHNHKGVADCLIGLAWVENALGHSDRAAQLLATNERLREAIHSPVPEDDRAELDDLLARIQSGLDPTSFQSAWADGRALTTDQAIALALAL